MFHLKFLTLSVLLCIAGLALLQHQADAQSCPFNQEYYECGTACPDRCSDDPNALTACTFQCVEGCQCPTGLYETNRGECVTRQQCGQRG